jgi:DNA-binding MarR family transcriptional regulator
MKKIDPAKTWTLNYRLLMSVITGVTAELQALGLESSKSLFLLAEVDDHPYPAELAERLSMPRPTVTVAVKRLEADGFVRREIDASDLRRHRLRLTPAGRKLTQRGLAVLSTAFAARLARLSNSEQGALNALLEKMS